MKTCPKCNTPHNKSGIFCSRTCANSRTFSEETNKKKSDSAKKYVESLSDDERKKSFEKANQALKKVVEDRYNNLPFDELSADMKREKILEEQNYHCLECGMGQEWNGKPLKFHLDHTDGNRTNNSRTNLRMLCPNCHSQTKTYCGKNGGKITNDQILEILDECDNNHQVCIKVGINPSIRSYKRIDRLRELSP